MTDFSNDCGCCAGDAHDPVQRFNAPGLPHVTYRIGEYGEIKSALLARLSSIDFPALAGLRTRVDDDFSIALCDAGAVMFDVLGFYQERFANEAWLRTATERRSMIELARLIGYQPAPGVAASTHLAFTLEDAPGMPSLAAGPVTIPVGTRAQSIPGPDEEPQTFETIEAVTARVEWNAMPVQTREPQSFVFGTTELFVAGVSNQVQVGDVILIVGDERFDAPGSDRWDARVISAVEVDNTRDFTRLTWAEGLGHGTVNPTEKGARAFVFRQRTALFGHNASDARLLRLTNNDLGLTTGTTDATRTWANYSILGNQLDLDGNFAKVVPGSWVLLAGGNGATGTPSLPGLTALYRASKVRQLSRTGYGLSGKVTRVDPDTIGGLANFALDTTLVLAQSEELKLTARPLAYPLYAATLALSRRDLNLTVGQALAISGKRQRLRVVIDDPTLVFKPDDGAGVAAKPGDSFQLAAAPTWLVFGNEIALSPETLDYVLRWKPFFPLRWRLIDRDGRGGTLDAPPPAISLQAALKDDAMINELAHVDSQGAAIVHTRDRTTLQLSTPLTAIYDRNSVAICANLALATHGEAVSEVAGSGDASTAGQRFMLKQAPLTFVSAATPSGRESTLEVRVDGQIWNEVPTLFGRKAGEHVYALRQDDDQHTIVQFGDGVEGARLPSGRDNLRLGYRKGIGIAGNVRGGQITTLLGRPLGVKTVNNPVGADGGQDRESRDEARRNAPLTMLTLGRAVSIQDYTDFARSFAGVAKAQAVWMRAGRSRGVFLSIAGPNGASVAGDSATLLNLAASLRRYGDALVPLQLKSYRPVQFRLEAKLKFAADALVDDVVNAVESTLRGVFSFDQRDFAQSVSIDEVMAVIQSVDGVVAVDVDRLYRLDPGAMPALVPRLFAKPPEALGNGNWNAAELLTLEPGPLALGVMP